MSWGNKLLLTFIVFAGGMGYLVYRSMHVNFELVDKDYYKNELRYQEVIDATSNVNMLNGAVKLVQNADGILLELPVEMEDDAVEGEIFFYCAYDQKKDRKVKLETTKGGTQLIPSARVEPGHYTVKTRWLHGGQSYFSENNLTVK